MIDTQPCETRFDVCFIMFKSDFYNGIRCFNHRAKQAKVNSVRVIEVYTSVGIPMISGLEFVVPWIIGFCQIEWKDQPAFSRNIQPMRLQIGSDIVCVNICLKMRSANVVEIQLAILFRYHISEILEQMLPIGTLRTVKPETIGFKINEGVLLL